jgi:hypothetical protein
MMILHILAFVGGASVVVFVLSAAVRTVVVPRGEHVLLSALVFGVTRWGFRLFAKEAHSYERRDRVMSRFAPTALMLMPIVWAVGIILGFTPIYWALGEDSWRDALLLSGSSLTTLGFRSADFAGELIAAIIEALLGLGLVALLISFLPTIYGHFSRRESTVAKIFIWSENEHGTSDPVTLLVRSHEIGGLQRLDEVWTDWDSWFVELSESHRSFPALSFFRSPDPDRSWITGAGIALDLASLYLAVLDIEANPRAAMMLRSGFLSLRSLCDFFGIPYDPSPRPDDPVSVTREEFDAAVDRLAGAGVPVRADRDAAWRAFAGWRVNYDVPLTHLADFTMAPWQPWVSDRAVRFRPSLRTTAGARRRKA